MNRGVQYLTQLAALSELRDLVEQTCKAETVWLSRKSQDQAVRCEEARRALGEVLNEWESALTADRLDPASILRHSLTVTAQEQQSNRLAAELASTETELDASRIRHSHARAAQSCASRQFQQARRQSQRHKEERHLALIDDSSALRATLS